MGEQLKVRTLTKEGYSMKRLTLLMALCVVFWGVTICTSQESLALGTLGGIVTDAGTALPIEGVTIEVRVADSLIASATTDDLGFYSISDLQAGQYDITASKLGYVSAVANAVTITDGVNSQDFVLTFPLQGHVTQVTDEDPSLPIEGATVEVIADGNPISPTTTDTNGFYSFPGLQAGTYDVTVSKSCYQSQTVEDVSVVVDTTTVQDFVLVPDTAAPVLDVSVNSEKLWPPNHKYRNVTATVEVSDDMDPNPTVTLVSVTSNEPDNGKGDGNTINDIVVVDNYTFKLRAERSGMGSGRIYTITYKAVNSCGIESTATATVTVPKNKKKVR
jgi:hypothetical protein